VLHVKHPPIDVDSLIWEHRLLALLQFQLPEIPAPLHQALSETAISRVPHRVTTLSSRYA
jgi:hypothetical protein